MASIWDLIEDLIKDDPEFAKDLKERSDLLIRIVGTVQKNEWSHAKAAQVMEIDAFTVKSMREGHIDRFSKSFLEDVMKRIEDKGFPVWNFPESK